jgi:hypothetical protein
MDAAVDEAPSTQFRSLGIPEVSAAGYGRG